MRHAVNQSQCSAQLNAAERTAVPPHVCARMLISPASRTAVWSFQRTNIAFGLASNSFRSERGAPVRSTATGVDPVVSTEIALMRDAVPRGACAIASRIEDSNASM